MIKALEELRDVVRFGYLGYSAPEAGGDAALVERIYDEAVKFVPFQALRQQLKDLDARRELFTIKIKREGAEIRCCICPLAAWGGDGYLVFQKIAEFTESDLKILGAFSAMAGAAGAVADNKPADDTNRFRSEMLNMRYIQAMLFPEFSEVSGFDVGSAFFPSEQLSGNFIDGFYIDKNTYQFVMCDISAKGIHSSFVGSALRTLLRTHSTVHSVPSAVIAEVSSKISKIITGIKYLALMVVVRLNTKTGNALLSANGGQPVLVYHKKKNKCVYPHSERPAAGGAAEEIFRDISIQMEPGDCLLLYARGIADEVNETTGERYGESRLIDQYMKSVNLSSKEIVRSVAETIYEFINYAPQRDDIIIANIKRS